MILAEVARHVVAHVRRAYGNWESPHLKSWEGALHAYAIRPIQQFACSGSRNASDMAMVIDAMDLLYARNLDGFANVSSDADFTPLVMRLRQPAQQPGLAGSAQLRLTQTQRPDRGDLAVRAAPRQPDRVDPRQARRAGQCTGSQTRRAKARSPRQAHGALCAAALPAQESRDRYVAARQALVAQLRADARASPMRSPLDENVLGATGRVPRHLFVPAVQQRHACQDRPLAIGHGQTIWQPYIVALMTSLLKPAPGQRILQIGTGSGYQAAVLAALGAHVYTIEIVEPLARQAAQQLRRYPHVHTRIGDGYVGWPEHALFDAIIVTAAVTLIPPPLLEQLKPGGRMVIAVGSQRFAQSLTLVEKDAGGRVSQRRITSVRFVPLTGER